MTDHTGLDWLKTLLKFPFEGRNWQSNFLIGAALSLGNFVVPIVPMLFVSGYSLQIMRGGIEGQEPSMPEWKDWSNRDSENSFQAKGSAATAMLALAGEA